MTSRLGLAVAAALGIGGWVGGCAPASPAVRSSVTPSERPGDELPAEVPKPPASSVRAELEIPGFEPLAPAAEPAPEDQALWDEIDREARARREPRERARRIAWIEAEVARFWREREPEIEALRRSALDRRLELLSERFFAQADEVGRLRFRIAAAVGWPDPDPLSLRPTLRTYPDRPETREAVLRDRAALRDLKSRAAEFSDRQLALALAAADELRLSLHKEALELRDRLEAALDVVPAEGDAQAPVDPDALARTDLLPVLAGQRPSRVQFGAALPAPKLTSPSRSSPPNSDPFDSEEAALERAWAARFGYRLSPDGTGKADEFRIWKAKKLGR